MQNRIHSKLISNNDIFDVSQLPKTNIKRKENVIWN